MSNRAADIIAPFFHNSVYAYLNTADPKLPHCISTVPAVSAPCSLWFNGFLVFGMDGRRQVMAEGRLAGRIALVTGSSSGIGEAIALGFAREGADVIVHYRNRQMEANEIADEIRTMGRRAHVVQGDVADAAQVARMMADA